ncbi:hypothetical protein Pcinc_034023 [Petrolisthes cinctipes]|uniref:ATP-dependent DNA helicase PIF1 n=1 Tax=Petrolisthes cinctipes TaxID=88211 RepID=A0AAE1ER55_PETCI|nr:hypothetical protein Pcinc_034023 [Petrolisthes cinctipes]
METPKKEPSLQAPALQCSLTVETLHPNAATIKHSVTHKKVKLILGRNKFRDMIILVESPKHSFQYQVKGELQLHKRFMKEGKATVCLREANMNLMISNAPPNQLLVFLRMLASKKAVMGTENGTEGVSARTRLLSTLPKSFEEISPLTFKEYSSLRGNSGQLPLKEKNSNVPGESPVSTKRKRDIKDSTPVKPKVSRFLNPVTLTAEQKSVLQAVQGGHNVFFTGSAGTGKSFLLRRIIGALPPDVTFVTASTGVAACQIGGTTLHAFAGIGSGQAPLQQCFQLASRKVVAQQWKRCRHLIVDEISMVDGGFFKKLEAVGRMIRGNEKPFGGIQLIFCGDFLQLPPVTRHGEKRIFCFQTSAWDSSITLTLELTDVKRQDDPEFIDILQEVRRGRCPDKIVERLRETEKNFVERDGIKATRLCTHREDVEHINRQHLDKLPGVAQVFQSLDSDPSLAKTLDSQTPVTSSLELKIGTQVMLTKNMDVARGLVNGARGVITGFKNGGEGYPIVRFLCGQTTEIKYDKWTVRVPGGISLTRRQLPLKLAWAFSIHKSQGMTLDCAEMSLSRVFEAGQAYVALSRAKNLQGLRILDFDPSCVRAHPDVLKFYQSLRKYHCSEQQSIENYLI